MKTAVRLRAMGQTATLCDQPLMIRADSRPRAALAKYFQIDSLGHGPMTTCVRVQLVSTVIGR